jgi:DNA adenine methylase
MILRRLGNKKKIADEIQKYFPSHEIYIEPFFGAGGMFFNKPKVKYNIVNDLDSDVFNLFQVVSNNKDELQKAFYMMPVHSDLLDYWKKNKEDDQIKKAIRFLFLSNLTYLGKGSNITYNTNDSKINVMDLIDKTNKLIFDVLFNNCDCIKFINDICFRHGQQDKDRSFIYCDPPYLNTDNNYSNGFTTEKSNELFNTLQETKCRFAMSEFDHPFILEQAKKRDLNVIIIGERQNLKNRRTEILLTNYKNNQQTLF